MPESKSKLTRCLGRRISAAELCYKKHDNGDEYICDVESGSRMDLPTEDVEETRSLGRRIGGAGLCSKRHEHVIDIDQDCKIECGVRSDDMEESMSIKTALAEAQEGLTELLQSRMNYTDEYGQLMKQYATICFCPGAVFMCYSAYTAVQFHHLIPTLYTILITFLFLGVSFIFYLRIRNRYQNFMSNLNRIKGRISYLAKSDNHSPHNTSEYHYCKGRLEEIEREVKDLELSSHHEVLICLTFVIAAILAIGAMCAAGMLGVSVAAEAAKAAEVAKKAAEGLD